MPEGLTGRRIVLAGGSGGLGAELASLLASAGASLVVSYRTNRERAAQLKDIATVIKADLTSEQDRKGLLDAAPDLYGLVVLAGDPARAGGPSELEAAMLRSNEVNYVGPVLLAREAADRMRQSRTPGSIVLLSTMQAVSLFPGSTAYAGAKAALIHAARILAKECRGSANIRVNVVCPGVNDAGMAKPSIASGKYTRYVEEAIIPRFGRAADIARTVRFFLEPDNYITGQVLTVDGGLTL